MRRFVLSALGVSLLACSGLLGGEEDTPPTGAVDTGDPTVTDPTNPPPPTSPTDPTDPTTPPGPTVTGRWVGICEFVAPREGYPYSVSPLDWDTTWTLVEGADGYVEGAWHADVGVFYETTEAIVASYVGNVTGDRAGDQVTLEVSLYGLYAKVFSFTLDLVLADDTMTGAQVLWLGGEPAADYACDLVPEE